MEEYILVVLGGGGVGQIRPHRSVFVQVSVEERVFSFATLKLFFYLFN